MKLARFPGMVLFLVLALAGSARADEAYFMLVFASQRPVNFPAHAHTFATFVKATWPAPGCAAPQLQAWTISWMPRTLAIEVGRLSPEGGVNLDLHSSLRWALGDGQRISVWGPYQVRQELFDRALGRVGRLQSGAFCYKAVTTGYAREEVTNCVHAVGDLALDNPRLHLDIRSWGDSAGYFVTLSFVPWIIQPRQTHDWILPRLGLCNYPLVRRDLERNPTRNLILRPLQSLAHLSLKRSLWE
jgi:hypothetical protein